MIMIICNTILGKNVKKTTGWANWLLCVDIYLVNFFLYAQPQKETGKRKYTWINNIMSEEQYHSFILFNYYMFSPFLH